MAEHSSMKSRSGAILAAAFALPGVLPGVAEAQVTVPNATLIQFKYLYYRDYQDSGDRMTVKSPALYLLAPISSDWVFEIGAVHDSMSGASPTYHTVLSGASGVGIEDRRTAADVTVTRYFGRTALSLRGAYSTEDDYKSKAVGITLRHATSDQNTTFTIGFGYSDDRISPTDGPQFTEEKTITDAIVGISQVLTPNDIAQLNVYYAQQRGYLTDPYKAFWGIDNRPRSRDQWAGLFRWNHHFEGLDATMRSSYRYYRDDWEVSAHTVNFEWSQALPFGLTVTPSLRFTSQSSAKFYYDPVYDPLLGPPFPPGFLANPFGFYTSDQRLSAFGAFTPGIKVAKSFAGGWVIDARAEYYEQRAEWRVGGEGSPGLQPFKAELYQFGVMKKF
jgi:hypothetical protein